MDLHRQWLAGVEDEVAFWRAVLAGDRYPEFKQDLRERAAANAPLMSWIVAVLPLGVSVAQARILDIGAGPVSCVGWQSDGTRPEVTAIDPLVDRYRPLLDAAGLAPPVCALPIAGENLAHHFEAASFHVVHLRNALDQCWDPMQVLSGAARVLRPGGALLIHGQTDAAESSHAHGLHLWNMRVEDGDLVLWRGQRKYRVAQRFAGELACTEIHQDDTGHWAAAAFTKRRRSAGTVGSIARALGRWMGAGTPQETAGHQRQFLLDFLPQGSVGAEIGVLDGNFSRQILDSVAPKRLYLIDPWQYEASDTYKRANFGGGVPGGQARMDQRHAAVLKRFRHNIRRGQVDVRRGTSDVELTRLPDESLDWVYIDGNHLYEFVQRDLRLSLAKVRPGGYIAGDDYTEGGWWAGGVKRAVDEFAENPAVRLLKLRNGQFIFNKVGGMSIAE